MSEQQLLLLRKPDDDEPTSLDEYEETYYKQDMDELDQYFEDTHNEEDIALKTAEENNTDIRSLADEIVLLKEIFVDCAAMVFGQGEQVDELEQSIEQAVKNTDEGTKSLQKAEQYTSHGRGKIFDACVLVTGAGLGALGFIGGGWIGIPTMAAGLGLSTSVVIARNKLASSVGDE